MRSFDCPGCRTRIQLDEFDASGSVYCRKCAKVYPLRREAATAAAGSSEALTGDGSPPPEDAVTGSGAAATPASPATEPEVPGYRLEREVGRGGMGVVYEATQLTLDRRVAIKFLSPELSSHPALVQRFEKEARVLAKLSHPRIIQIIDKGKAGQAFYFVMEFVAGTSLRKRIPRRGMEPPDACFILDQVCDALAFIHSEGVIHRDVKPENILLAEKGGVKLGDFGLVGLLDEGSADERLTRSATAMGTLLYMAPEQRTDARHVDQRADIYSLGVTFYEMLTGQLPGVKYVPPSQLASGVDRRIDAVVDRALDAKPSGRYETVGQMVEELRAVPGWPGGGAQPAMVRRTVTADDREKETWTCFMERLERGSDGGGQPVLQTTVGEEQLKDLWRRQKDAGKPAEPPAAAGDSAEASAQAKISALWKKAKSKESAVHAAPSGLREPASGFRMGLYIAVALAFLTIIAGMLAR